MSRIADPFLEVRREEILLEVQIRTASQHQWTEVFERAADRLGRLRYGEKIDFGAAAEIGESVMSRLEAAADAGGLP